MSSPYLGPAPGSSHKTHKKDDYRNMQKRIRSILNFEIIVWEIKKVHFFITLDLMFIVQPFFYSLKQCRF